MAFIKKSDLKTKASVGLRNKSVKNLETAKPVKNNHSKAYLAHVVSVHEIELEMHNEELQLMQARLNASLVEYSEFFELSPTGYFVLDRDGYILKLNKRGCEKLQMSKENMIGKPFSFFIHGTANQDDFYRFRLDMVNAKDKHTTINSELRRSDGTSFSVQIKCAAIKEENSLFKYLLCSVSDVSLLREHEKQVELALSKANQLNEMKSSFITLASHEFRTPLTSILSCTWLVEKFAIAGQTVEMEKYLSRIRGSVKQLTVILDEFLSHEKLGSGKAVVSLETVNLHEFCEDLLVEFRLLYRLSHSITLQYKGAEVIENDRKILNHILTNLLSNAVKYSEDHSDVVLSISVTQKKVNIRVTDNGIGIPLEDQPLIFNRFYRANNVLNRQGTGLGLNIVQEYLKLIKGSIRFESTEGKGTTFFVGFPVLQTI